MANATIRVQFGNPDGSGSDGHLSAEVDTRPDGPSVLNLYPLLHHLVGETDAARGASHFHATLIDGLAQWLADAAHATGLRRVAPDSIRRRSRTAP